MLMSANILLDNFEQFFLAICNIKVLFPTGLRSVRIRSYYGPYSVRMLENTDQNNSEYGQVVSDFLESNRHVRSSQLYKT